ncbi:sialate O-acetylesterase [Pseudozobellia thermophila]|uniref:sialate O-acetylesterase n=1 Tax=Pseudozobellia thermophila TaxID=192903 RepID=UPI001FCD25CB|nr:sialate O-acetylesterase [Pseudozobellia thermophila]
MPKLIGNGAVLQRNTELTLWGWASPNESVELRFKGKAYTTTADNQGNWRLLLPPQPAGGPFKMDFKGTNRITVDNILFGEVWLCSGQSNMELTMSRLRDVYPDIIKSSENSKIRQFLVPDKYDFNTAHTDLDSGSWMEANPRNLLDFSGVAYFFAKDIFERYQVPVGLINAALGGSPVEAWMSEEGLKNFPEAYEELQRFKDEGFVAEIEKKDQKRQQEWFKKLEEEDEGLTPKSKWFSMDLDDSTWDAMNIPRFWADSPLGNVNGVVWFRKHFVVPEAWVGKEAKLWLGRMVDQDHVYVNGTFVGTTGYQYPPRKYTVNDSLLKKGDNTITIRLINQQGKGGFILDKPYFISVGTDTIDLKGPWKYKLGAAMPPLEGPTFIRWKPGGLYNRMISPLLNYKIKGVIWYQGESNTNQPERYFQTFPALIQNWRSQWNIGDFPFLYVQLANFMEETNVPVESAWAQLRQAQLNTLKVRNTGMAVITDLGEWNDIHPLNKADVGKRLAQLAYRLAYNETDARLSPIPKKAKFRTDHVSIAFDHVGSGLKINHGDYLKTFELSSDGKTFYRARAEIRGKNIRVENDKLKKPVAVRYAWSDNPAKANLFSKEGLPASPFELRKE